jgi:hypothetical protein
MPGRRQRCGVLRLVPLNTWSDLAQTDLNAAVGSSPSLLSRQRDHPVGAVLEPPKRRNTGRSPVARRNLWEIDGAPREANRGKEAPLPDEALARDTKRAAFTFGGAPPSALRIYQRR